MELCSTQVTKMIKTLISKRVVYIKIITIIQGTKCRSSNYNAHTDDDKISSHYYY
jgi:hypothetical protein